MVPQLPLDISDLEVNHNKHMMALIIKDILPFRIHRTQDSICQFRKKKYPPSDWLTMVMAK